MLLPNALGPGPLRVEAAPLSIIMPTATWVAHAVLGLHLPIPLGKPDDVQEARGVCFDGTTRGGLKPVPVKMRSPLQGASLWSFVSWPWNGLDSRWRPQPAVEAKSPLAAWR
jgi:hypothetical protein